jgi:hypothetical protein
MSTPSISQTPAAVSTEKARSYPKRLIVLVPQPEVDEAMLARRVWTMALSGRSDVLYVALVRDADEEARTRRSLALLTSMTRDDRLHVASQVILQAQWLKALRPLCQPGDAIVCAAGQTVKRFGRSALLLSDQLVAEFGEVVRVLDDICVEASSGDRQVWPLIRNVVPIAIIAGFLEFQMWAATQLVRGAASNTVLALSVVVEFSLIWLWVSRVH